MRLCDRYQIPFVVRGSGTSLSESIRKMRVIWLMPRVLPAHLGI
ncbi:hypothetical protein ACFLV7_06545 [Chloroflexota bacterium]